MRKEKLAELKSYIEELKTIRIIEKKEKTSSFLNIENVTVQLNNGKIIQRDRLYKQGKEKADGNAAIILPITTEGNVILTVQPRIFTESTVGVELPAGYLEKGEEGIKAALRELEEETGYSPEKLEYLTSYYQDQGCSAAYNQCFLAANCRKVKQQQLDKDEYIRYFECYYDELLELEELGYINDAGSKITIAAANKKIKRR